MGSYARSLQEKMLANLTSLLWGSETTMPAPDTTTLGCPEAPDTLTKFNIRATTPTDEEEADWLLVDRADVGEACVGGGEGHGTNLQATSISQHQQATAAPSETTTPTAITTTPAAPTITKTTRTNINLALNNNNMKSAPVAASSIPTTPTCGGTIDGNEWLMTPPPCFTRSQADPLTTSPLEDLLIEHPSMSVYLPRPNTTYTTTASTTTKPRLFPRAMSHSNSPPPPSASPCSQPASIIAEGEDSPMREGCDNVQPETTTTAVAPTTTSLNRSSGVAHRSASLLQAIDVLRPTQKAQRRREERRLKRKPMERSNMVRQVASESNKPSRRRNMMAPSKFSRAVNNRKC